MKYHGLQIILCKPFQNFSLFSWKSIQEIIPDSIEIDGTTIMRQTEVKLFCTTTQQKTKFCYAVNELDYV